MEIEEVTNDLMKMLELKLLNHIPEGEFNQDNITHNVMKNLLDNLYMKSLFELKQAGVAKTLAPKQTLKTCLEMSGQLMCDEPKSIQKAFDAYLKENQSPEIYDEAVKMSEYLIGALPLLIEEYVATHDF